MRASLPSCFCSAPVAVLACLREERLDLTTLDGVLFYSGIIEFASSPLMALFVAMALRGRNIAKLPTIVAAGKVAMVIAATFVFVAGYYPVTHDPFLNFRSVMSIALTHLPLRPPLASPLHLVLQMIASEARSAMSAPMRIFRCGPKCEVDGWTDGGPCWKISQGGSRGGLVAAYG